MKKNRFREIPTRNYIKCVYAEDIYEQYNGDNDTEGGGDTRKSTVRYVIRTHSPVTRGAVTRFAAVANHCGGPVVARLLWLRGTTLIVINYSRQTTKSFGYISMAIVYSKSQKGFYSR